MKQNGNADKYDLYPGFAYHKSNPYRVEWPCLGIKPYRPIRYGDSVLYGAAVRHNDHQHLPVNTSLFMASENTQAASSSDPELVVRTVQIGALTNMVPYINTMAVGTTRTRTWDFLVKEQGGRKIVVALIEDSATVKRLKKKGAEVWLMPENPAYDPIDGRAASILGKVKAVIREY